MKDLSTRKREEWQCDSIIEQMQKISELSGKYHEVNQYIVETDENCHRYVWASRKKKNYRSREVFVKEVINTKGATLP